MSFVAAAVVGSGVVGAWASNKSAKSAAGAVEAGAGSAAEATVESTRMQIEEIGRQFNYGQALLRPHVERANRAGARLEDMLGFEGTSAPALPPVPGSAPPDTRTSSYQARPAPAYRGGQTRSRPTTAEEFTRRTTTGKPSPGFGGPGSPTNVLTARQAPDGSYFIDPNLDPTRLADVNTFQQSVRDTQLAGTEPGADPFRNYITGNRIAADTAGESALVRRAEDVRLADLRGDERLAEGAAGTGVYGNKFQASPGYAFQREEMERQLDRVRSRGGNYGGRAVIEAQRRAQGLALGDYYNWAAGRERDLMRRGDAERVDIGRGDQFATYDVGRGDAALSEYERQRIMDQGRGDEAYINYLNRRAGDASRLDAAAAQEDQLIAQDQTRGDQAYYNYLNYLSTVAGSPATGQAVSSAEAAGAQTAGAYAQQGGNLASIYSRQGSDLANINATRYTNLNNAAQSGIANWLTYRQGNQPPGPPTTPTVPDPRYGTWG